MYIIILPIEVLDVKSVYITIFIDTVYNILIY